MQSESRATDPHPSSLELRTGTKCFAEEFDYFLEERGRGDLIIKLKVWLLSNSANCASFLNIRDEEFAGE